MTDTDAVYLVLKWGGDTPSVHHAVVAAYTDEEIARNVAKQMGMEIPGQTHVSEVSLNPSGERVKKLVEGDQHD